MVDGHKSTAPPEPDVGPERCSWIAHMIGRVVGRLMGWRFEGGVPAINKMVFIAAPHTSNWDFIVALAAAWSFRLKLRWLGKHTLFRFPFGWFMRALGGIPVNRSARHGMVEQMVEVFQRLPRLTLMVPAAGTRAKRERWKSGFYHIARAANVPVVCCPADYSRKVGTLSAPFYLTGDVRADMERIRALFDGVLGRHPDLMTPIRMKEEDTIESVPAN